MRDASCELADSIHLLRLAKLLFQVFAGADVSNHSREKQQLIKRP